MASRSGPIGARVGVRLGGCICVRVEGGRDSLEREAVRVHRPGPRAGAGPVGAENARHDASPGARAQGGGGRSPQRIWLKNDFGRKRISPENGSPPTRRGRGHGPSPDPSPQPWGAAAGGDGSRAPGDGPGGGGATPRRD